MKVVWMNCLTVFVNGFLKGMGFWLSLGLIYLIAQLGTMAGVTV